MFFSAAGNDISDNANANNTAFTIKSTILYVLVVTLSVKYKQKLSKLLSKVFKRSAYWNEYKSKSGNKIQQVNIHIFSNQN